MPSPARSPSAVIRESVNVCCKSLLDMAYTLFVIVLLILVAFFTYIIAIEEAPFPGFVLRLMENKLEARGAALSMKGVRITPNGRIIIEEPILRSNELQDTIAQADSITIKINPSLLIFGSLNITNVSISNGRFLAPAVLSPSGVSQVIADRIDLNIDNNRKSLSINFAKLQSKNLRFFASGSLKKDFLLIPQGRPPKTLGALLINNLPKFWEIEKHFQLIDQADIQARFDVRSKEKQTIELTTTVPKCELPNKTRISTVRIKAQLPESGGLALEVTADTAHLPQELRVANPKLSAVWPQLPTRESWLPTLFAAHAAHVEKAETPALSGFVAEGSILDSKVSYAGLFTFAQKAFSISGNHNLVNKTTHINLEGEIGQHAPNAIAALLKQPSLATIATIHEAPYLKASATLDESFKPLTTNAFLDAGPITIQGARFDRSLAFAETKGPHLSVPDIFLRSGKQNGWLGIDYNLATKKRRFLIDGLFDPNTLNDWFPPWWADFWSENFQFPEGGFYCLLDSRGTHGQPDAQRITGLGMSPNLGIRGEPMDFLRTRMFIRLHYFDLYDFDLRRPEGRAEGETQIYVARDPVDQKDKLSGLWIDATSSIDPRIGPTVLYEIATDIEEILEPYAFENPPTVKAIASTKRIQGEFQYEAELDIDMPEAFTFFDYPLDGAKSKVFLENDIIRIPEATASLGAGVVRAKADIFDDDITLEASLEKANFGKALQATVQYFAVDDPTIAEDVEIDKLTDYGGLINMDFAGTGILGDSLSYEGKGVYNIKKADLGKLQMFGLLSKVLEATPLRFSTLSFENAVGSYSAHKTYLEYPDLLMTGPAARVKAEGRYNLDAELLDFKAKLFPFRQSSMPVMALVGVVLEPLSHALEVRLTGTLGEPKVSLFSGSSQK